MCKEYVKGTLGGGGQGSDSLMDVGSPLGVLRCVETWQRWWLYIIVNVLKATDLYIFKRLILCYVYFTSRNIVVLNSLIKNMIGYTEHPSFGLYNDANLSLSLFLDKKS